MLEAILFESYRGTWERGARTRASAKDDSPPRPSSLRENEGPTDIDLDRVVRTKPVLPIVVTMPLYHYSTTNE